MITKMREKEFISINQKSQKRQSTKVKKVKDRIKKGEIKVKEKLTSKRKGPKTTRGVIYLGHLPHGFYEKELREYFNQFGKITRVHCSRSKKNGSSKGYAFVEFLNTEVAKVAAETMNNYLMLKKLLKAVFIPCDKVPKNLFTKSYNWTPFNNPGVENTKSHRLQYNKNIPKNNLNVKLSAKAIKMNKVLKKLQAAGITQNLEISDKPEGVNVKFVCSTNEIESETEEIEEECNSSKPVLEIDESDEEIVFKTPPGVITRFLKKKSKGLSGVTKKTKTPMRSKTKKPAAKSTLKMGLLNALKTTNNEIQLRSRRLSLK